MTTGCQRLFLFHNLIITLFVSHALLSFVNTSIICLDLTMSFESLSNELVAAIFGEIQTFQRPYITRKDLYSVSLCCRRFSEIVKPYLYLSFMQRGTHSAPAFLRTLLENAQLRTYVKHIDLSSPEDTLGDGVQCFELPFLSDKEGDWLQGYLPDLDCEYCKNWQEALFAEKIGMSLPLSSS
jgi:hypothetical protein